MFKEKDLIIRITFTEDETELLRLEKRTDNAKRKEPGKAGWRDASDSWAEELVLQQVKNVVKRLFS